MNVLFLTLLDFDSIEEHNIYTDLLREFYRNGNTVCIVSPVEKRENIKSREIIVDEKLRIAKPQIGNMQKTNIIEKGISTLLIEPQFVHAIKKYFSDVKFDLVLYSTPPITLAKAVKFVKKRDSAKTYLMLKDIFPQNAVDLGMMKATGPKSFLYRFFRKKEKVLYAFSDKIGCMSQANVDYVLRHNPEVSAERVEICPNCIEVQDLRLSTEEKVVIRQKYDIPLNKKVFVYGGNLGKPQGIDFMIDCLRSQKNNKEAYFLIVGAGTEYGKIESFVNKEKQANVRLMKHLPKDDYDRMVAACDVGMIFLDYRFTIPNFPSRLLAYMQVGLPVLACTDPNTDVGKVIVNGGFGWWCESEDVSGFANLLAKIVRSDLNEKKSAAFSYLLRKYDVERVYNEIYKSVV